ncbi:MAG TPA: hypothetical protein DDY11_02995, partial [Leclercia adecarboxylata]|nr:hypothetical protein [Leclercia adecarboxylata]
TVNLLESRTHCSKRAIDTQLVDGIQSLFQSLNIEVQDVSPDVQKALIFNKTEDYAFTVFRK